MIEIEKGVKMPSAGAKEFVRIMAKMNFGDSFLINDREITPKLSSNIYAAARAARIAIKQKMAGDNLRVWRVYE